jgi:hypothetical protein
MAKKDWLDQLFDINSRMFSTEFEPEAAECRQRINKLLREHGKIANDSAVLLEIVRKRRAAPQAPPAPPPPPGDPITGFELFKGLRAVFKEFLSLDEEHEYAALGLWCMHAHIFNRFMHTPRLILRSAVRDCGKTTALGIIEGFVPNPKKSDNMTAAAFFRLTDWGLTLLLDEVDNLGLLTDPVFRTALNSGYRRGGTIDRIIRNQPATFKTFAPVVLAGIGTVPLPLARRSIVIKLNRDPKAPINLRQFDSLDKKQIDVRADPGAPDGLGGGLYARQQATDAGTIDPRAVR